MIYVNGCHRELKRSTEKLNNWLEKLNETKISKTLTSIVISGHKNIIWINNDFFD